MSRASKSRTHRPREPGVARETATQAGRRAEDLAVAWLMRCGLQIIARNVRCPGGEIDVVAREDDVLVFVEVRYRRAHALVDPLSTITHQKRRRLVRAANAYLQAHPAHARCPQRFDVIAVSGPVMPIQWVRDAFVQENNESDPHVRGSWTGGQEWEPG